MTFKLASYSCFNKDLKSLSKQMQIETKEAIGEIQNNPSIGEQMKGGLKHITKYAYFHNPAMRILYSVNICEPDSEGKKICSHKIEHDVGEIETCNGIIDFIHVKTRQECDNLYSKVKQLQEYIRSPEK